jgi:hypothetical protein
VSAPSPILTGIDYGARRTGHSLRIGLASTGRKKGKDGIAIADQGGARHSHSMLSYMQREGGWDDNASVSLT